MNRLARAIIKIWEKEIFLSKDILFFLESACGITTPFELEHALQNEDFTDREMILEMLLFPDQHDRLAIEPLLGKLSQDSKSGQGQITQIIDALVNAHSHILLKHPDREGPISVDISHVQAAVFVARFYLDRTIDPDIRQALESCLPEVDALGCKVLLRSTSKKLAQEKSFFLITFIQNAKGRFLGHYTFYDLFKLTLTILGEVPENQPPESYFLKKRQQTKKMLIDIRQFEKKKDRFSMEYLMMSRYIVPQDSFENTFEQLRKLDVINDIQGILSPLEPVSPQTRNLGQFDPQTDMDNILKILS
ncbi:MAG: hypothetical protein ABIJ59_08650 [Pseudomonadota bacterium]